MTDKPNILLITSDQHRADALGIDGHHSIRTPHLDSLAFAGCRFTRAYSTCPICMPARTTLLTGKDAVSFGCPHNSQAFTIDYQRERTLPSLLGRAGYQTEFVGKTHFLIDPSDRAGFDHVTQTHRLYKQRLRHSGQIHPGTGIGGNEMSPSGTHLPEDLGQTYWCTDECLEFLDARDRTQPFFLWASYEAPHPPNSIHEPYYSMYDDASQTPPLMPDWMSDDNAPLFEYINRHKTNPLPMDANTLNKVRGVYFGMITYLDHQIGRLLGRMMELGIFNDTLIIYTTDHGEKLGDFGSFWKASFLEPSTRIPLVVKWPTSMALEPGRRIDSLASLEDLLPTLCDFGGAEVPDGIDGHSLRPAIEGASSLSRSFLWGQYDEATHMLRTDRFKYIYYTDDGKELLFDMDADPSESTNLSGDENLIQPLREQLVEILAEKDHPHVADNALLNRHKEKPPISEVRAQNLMWLGLRRAGQKPDLTPTRRG